MEQAGPVVLITGASSGIGAATAALCARQGLRVVATARRVETLEQACAALRAEGHQAVCYSCDVRDAGQIEALCTFASATYGRIDALVANAGIPCHGPFAELDDADLAAVVETNLLGALRCVRAVLGEMLRRGSGQVVLITSVTNGLRWPDDHVYAATKAALARLAHGLRGDLRGTGVSVSEVMPGVVATPLNQDAFLLPKASPEQVARAILGVLRRPRPLVVVPGWYRPLLLLNRLVPGAIDLLIRRHFTRK